MLHAERAPEAPQDHVPRGTTPTWEMELLLSGATVFGLLQLPGWMDPSFYAFFQRADQSLAQMLVPLYLYVKASILTLSVTFVAHLALRAYWIALVGLHSVYPGGLRWEKLRVGVVLRAALEPITPPVPARIEAADNRASRVFALGLSIALILLVPTVVVSLGILLTLGLRAAGGGDVGPRVLLGTLTAFFLPFLLAMLVDRVAGRRLAQGGLPARALGRVFRVYDKVGFGAASNPLMALFQSHEGAARTLAVVFAVMFSVFGVVFWQFTAAMGEADYGDFAGLPDDQPGALEAALPGHYASQRPADQVALLPYLPDRVVRGPYVELFVPYLPRRHAPAMRASCGEAVAVVDGGGPPAAALSCLASILDLRLDGEALAVPLLASQDPLTGMRGVLAMIPAGGLAPGRHELTVRRPPRRGRSDDQRPFRIPFWR
jgi:hypothetical protein